MLCIMNSCFSVAFIRYVFSFDTGEECRQTLDFPVVAFLKSRVVCYATDMSMEKGIFENI